MKTKNYSFELPKELIAQYPPKTRGSSRLLLLEKKSGAVEHHYMNSLPDLIEPGSLMVFNNSKVYKARVIAENANGAETDVLFSDSYSPLKWKCLIRRAKRHRPGREFLFPGKVGGRITGRVGPFSIVELDRAIDESFFEIHGSMPLPPYIKRKSTEADDSRYQTVYAGETGSIAAPTAGLHFTHDLLDRLKNTGIEIAYLTLHVGPGTFFPVRTEEIEAHEMHSEVFTISEETASAVEKAKAEGRKIIAVGTTSVRSLESAWDSGRLRRGLQETDLFIYPPHRFSVADCLFTNFHTPESTLLMLVCAFAGYENTMKAYRRAVEEQYRFFSYGDAMYIR